MPVTNSDNDNINWDSDDSTATKLMENELRRRMTDTRPRDMATLVKNASDAVERYLQKTGIPVVVIGGKAAAFHLANADMPDRNKVLVTSTNDYDLAVEFSFVKALAGDISKVLQTVIPQDLLMCGESGTILLMGVRRNNGMLESLVDIHPVKKLPASIQARDTIRYATPAFLLNQIAKYPASNDEIVKAIKRQRRQHHLQLLHR